MTHDLDRKSKMTFEEFKKEISPKSLLVSEKVADFYGKWPPLLKALTNLDPTGIAGMIDQVLTENDAQREKENILFALYCLFQVMSKITERIKKLEEAYVKEQVPSLTYLYFNSAKECYRDFKIECLRNIWFNGILYNDRSLDEKARIFTLIQSLSEKEIVILRTFFEEQRGQEFDKRQPLKIEELASRLSIDKNHIQQMCISLQGKGLLHDHGIGKFDYPGPKNFVMTDYVKLVAEYLEEPADQ